MTFHFLQEVIRKAVYAVATTMSISLIAACSPMGSTVTSSQIGVPPQSSRVTKQRWRVFSILKIENPLGIAVNPTLDVYFTGRASHEAQVLLPGGTVKNLGGHLSAALGIAAYKKQVFVADSGHALVKKIFPDGAVTEIGSGWKDPVSIDVDAGGNIYVLDPTNQNIVRLQQNKQTTIFTGPNGCGLDRMGMDGRGNLYASCIDSDQVLRINEETGMATPVCSGWHRPYAVGSDNVGDVYVSNSGVSGNTIIFECSTSGKLSTIQPDDNVGSIAGIAPYNGDLYIAGAGKSEIYKLVPPKSVPH